MKNWIYTFNNPNIFTCNVYVLIFEDTTILIDAWYYDWELKSFLNDKNVDAILLTHWHWDHIREVDRIKNDFPDAKVYIHKDDIQMLKDTSLNCSFLVWTKEIIINSEIEKLEEWNTNINDIEISVFHTPWHTYWWVMYYFKKQNALFTWDTVMWDSIWTLATPTWNEKLMIESLKKFKNLPIKKDTITYPWHWEPIIYEEILKNNLFLRQ